MAVQLARKLFTIDDYHRMAEVGILSEDDRVELIDGEIVLMSSHRQTPCWYCELPGRALAQGFWWSGGHRRAESADAK